MGPLSGIIADPYSIIPDLSSIIANPCCVIADPCGDWRLSGAIAAIGDSAGPDSYRCATH